jgi:uncharacterized protein
VKIIGLEEHFVTADVVDAWQRLDPDKRDVALGASLKGDIARRLADVDAERIAAMDETGLDIAVLSLTTPGLQNLPAKEAVALQTVANDALSDAVRAHPDRLQGFATLATPEPEAAARELERAVKELGFDGAMLYGRTGDRPLDEPAFWPIFEAAEALRAPLYLHPQSPPPAVRAAYYDGFDTATSAALATHGIGWHYDVGLALLRMILHGVFDRFPQLQVIVGHWGEVVLFYLERAERVTATAQLAQPLRDYFRTNVFVTPGGVYSDRYLRWAIEVVGVERVLYATDYPFVWATDGGARRFLQDADLSDADRQRIASGTWDELCAGIRR